MKIINDPVSIKVILKSLKEINKRLKEVTDYSTELDDEDSKAKKRISYNIYSLTKASSCKNTYIPLKANLELKETFFNKKEYNLLNSILEEYGLELLTVYDSEELYQWLKNHKDISSIEFYEDKIKLKDNLLEIEIGKTEINDDIKLSSLEYYPIFEYELSSEEFNELLNKKDIFSMYFDIENQVLSFNIDSIESDSYMSFINKNQHILGTPTKSEIENTSCTIRLYDYKENDSLYEFELEIDSKKYNVKNTYIILT